MATFWFTQMFHSCESERVINFTLRKPCKNTLDAVTLGPVMQRRVYWAYLTVSHSRSSVSKSILRGSENVSAK